MSKRIRKKRARMQLIKAFENMGEGEGVVIVGGYAVKFYYSQIQLPNSYNVDPDMNIYASMKGMTEIKKKEDAWKV